MQRSTNAEKCIFPLNNRTNNEGKRWKEVIASANVILLSDLKISDSKAQPVLFTFPLVQFLPLQRTFVLLFPILAITFNFTQVSLSSFSFFSSLLASQCAVNCLLTSSVWFLLDITSLCSSLLHSLTVLWSGACVALLADTDAISRCGRQEI